MIFFHGHIFDTSEYFATDSDHLLKCREISQVKLYFKVLMFNCVFSVVHILLILEKTRSVPAFLFLEGRARILQR